MNYHSKCIVVIIWMNVLWKKDIYLFLCTPQHISSKFIIIINKHIFIYIYSRVYEKKEDIYLNFIARIEYYK